MVSWLKVEEMPVGQQLHGPRVASPLFVLAPHTGDAGELTEDARHSADCRLESCSLLCCHTSLAGTMVWGSGEKSCLGPSLNTFIICRLRLHWVGYSV